MHVTAVQAEKNSPEQSTVRFRLIKLSDSAIQPVCISRHSGNIQALKALVASRCAGNVRHNIDLEDLVKSCHDRLFRKNVESCLIVRQQSLTKSGHD